MHHRELAAIAVTATVAATPALATVAEDLATAPPASADTVSAGPVSFANESCWIASPWLQGTTVATQLAGNYDKGWGSPCEVPGTFSLQASADHSHWKALAQTHQSSWALTTLTHECLSGTSWYQGYFVADDGSVTIGTDSAYPTQLTC
jgi:hypothetical protein